MKILSHVLFLSFAFFMFWEVGGGKGMSECVIAYVILLHLKLMCSEMSADLFFLLKPPVTRGSSTNAGGTVTQMRLRPFCFEDQTFAFYY